MKEYKDWKERFNREFDKEYPSVRSYTAGHLQEWVINFIDQLISERDKEYMPQIDENTSDGYHTFKELYEYRLLYNAGFFNELAIQGLSNVHKSKKHNDGELCFGGGWFVVMAQLPTGQISNHYEMKYWNLFRIPEQELADKWDGHTPQDVVRRLSEYNLLERKTS